LRPVEMHQRLPDCALERVNNTAVPAKAGTHAPTGSNADEWVPAFTGTADALLGNRALRLGLRQIKGLSETDAKRLVEARGDGYRDAEDLARRSGLGRAALERLAAADALRSLDRSHGGLDRRRGLWALKALGDPPLPLFAASDAPHPGPLPATGERESS